MGDDVVMQPAEAEEEEAGESLPESLPESGSVAPKDDSVWTEEEAGQEEPESGTDVAVRGKAKHGVRYLNLRPDAKTIYLALGPNRSIRAVHRTLISRYGEARSPLNAQTLDKWCRADGWVAEARKYDEKLARSERSRLLKEQEGERRKRRAYRLEDAAMIRSVARDLLTPRPEQKLPDGTVRPARQPGPRELEAASMALARAAAEERLDLGEATARLDAVSSDGSQGVTNVIFNLPAKDPPPDATLEAIDVTPSPPELEDGGI